jgi:murein L,D-transpeptidase YcbB/YkuD
MPEVFTKPGTANVTPADRAKLAPLLKHLRREAHPFTACYRDQRKHGLSADHAARRCAVLKDLIRGTTKWRGNDKNLSVAELQHIVDLADAAGTDCVELRKLRTLVTDLAAEGEKGYDWRKQGNRQRGVAIDGKAYLQSADGSLKRNPRMDGETKRMKKYGSKAQAKRAVKNADFESKHPRASAGQSTGGQFIKKGSSGEEVKTVQKELGIKASGKFDRRTQAAVRAFQRKNGLQVDGVVGKQTVAEMRGKKASTGALTRSDKRFLRR